MHSQQDTALFNRRLLRFFLWASLMFIAFVATAYFDLRRTIMVPMVFLPLMVPMVLLPLTPRQIGARKDPRSSPRT